MYIDLKHDYYCFIGVEILDLPFISNNKRLKIPCLRWIFHDIIYKDGIKNITTIKIDGEPILNKDGKPFLERYPNDTNILDSIDLGFISDTIYEKLNHEKDDKYTLIGYFNNNKLCNVFAITHNKLFLSDIGFAKTIMDIDEDNSYILIQDDHDKLMEFCQFLANHNIRTFEQIKDLIILFNNNNGKSLTDISLEEE